MEKRCKSAEEISQEISNRFWPGESPSFQVFAHSVIDWDITAGSSCINAICEAQTVAHFLRAKVSLAK